MNKLNFWKHLAIGFIIALVFGVTLAVDWEIVFVNFILGFGVGIIKMMRKAKTMKYAIVNYMFPIFVAGAITSICIALAI